MSTASKSRLISVEEYLQGELYSDIRHEYLAGEIYAMTGAKINHNCITMNVAILLGIALKGKPCRAFGPDMKIKVQSKAGIRFYYPDVSVVCESNDGSELFQDKPVVIVEVLSDSTRRIDLLEKVDAYLSIDSLQHYVIVEQDFVGVTVYSRDKEQFTQRNYAKLEDRIKLEGIELALPLTDVYEDVFPQAN